MRTVLPQIAFVCAFAISLSALSRTALAQPVVAKQAEIVQQRIESYRLWAGRPPGAQGQIDDGSPTVTVLRPQGGQSNGTAVVIAPGGAYIGLAGMLEGVEPAAWFTARGVTAFILTYRTGPNARLPVPLFDGARGVRLVRANAETFGVDPQRIGMMGFSAGGHLAATTAVDATEGDPASVDPIERVSSRPDFLILVYPWLDGTQVRADGTSSYCDFAEMGGAPRCDPQGLRVVPPRRARHEGCATDVPFSHER
jgi:acetyl esterase/lipase